MERLRIEQESLDDGALLRLDGEIDVHTADTLRAAVDGLDGEPEVITLDLENITFVDSIGLRVIVAVHRELDDRGGKLVLRTANETVTRALDYAGLAGHLHLEA